MEPAAADAWSFTINADGIAYRRSRPRSAPPRVPPSADDRLLQYWVSAIDPLTFSAVPLAAGSGLDRRVIGVWRPTAIDPARTWRTE
jgi:hypothetical protein